MFHLKTIAECTTGFTALYHFLTQSYFFDTISVNLFFVKHGVKNTDVFFASSKI